MCAGSSVIRFPLRMSGIMPVPHVTGQIAPFAHDGCVTVICFTQVAGVVPGDP
jgi:hypothetical protein